MQTAKDFVATEAFSLLIQGPPGSGKTTLALKFPRPYISDLDNNIGGTIRRMRLEGKSPQFKYDRPDIMKDEKTGLWVPRPLKDRYLFMVKGLKEAAADPEVDTIISDGATKLNAYICAEIARQFPLVDGRARTDGEMTIKDWALHQYIWQHFITTMQSCGKMFVLTAHEEASDRSDMPGMTLISVQGKKVQATLAGMFTDVWRCEVKDTLNGNKRDYKWLVRTMQTSSLQLKNSLGLPDTFEMNWDTIVKALERGNKQ